MRMCILIFLSFQGCTERQPPAPTLPRPPPDVPAAPSRITTGVKVLIKKIDIYSVHTDRTALLRSCAFAKRTDCARVMVKYDSCMVSCPSKWIRRKSHDECQVGCYEAASLGSQPTPPHQWWMNLDAPG